MSLVTWKVQVRVKWVETRATEVRLRAANVTQNAMFNAETASDTAVERAQARLDIFVGQYILVFCLSKSPKQIYYHINPVC